MSMTLEELRTKTDAAAAEMRRVAALCAAEAKTTQAICLQTRATLNRIRDGALPAFQVAQDTGD
jgi:hypothetical protein